MQTSIIRLKQVIDIRNIAVYWAFMLIGLTFTVYGPTIPYLLGDYQISIGQAGLFISFMAMGRMFSVIASGIMTDVFGRKPLIIIGSSLLTLGLFGIGSLSTFYLALLFASLAGIGHGMVDTSGSALVVELNPNNVSKYLNITHMFFGVGCLIGPIIAGILLSLNFNWRLVYYVKTMIGIIVVCLLSSQSFPQKEKSSNFSLEFKGMFNFTIFLLAGVIFLYSGVGHSLNTWINKYMVDIANLSIFFAASSLAFYNLGITLGRLVCSFFTEKIGYSKTILFLSLLSFISIIIAVFSNTAIIIVSAFTLTGFFFGGLFPTVIAIAGELYPQHRGTIIGILITLAALASMIIPASIGFLSQYFGLIISFRTLLIYVLALVLTAILLQKRVK